MEIVYLISRAKVAGPINQALNILSGLNRIKGVHAVLMTMNDEIPGNSWLNRYKEAGIDIVQMGFSPREIRKSVRFLRQYVADHHVNIVHSSGYRADIVNEMAQKNNGTVSTQRCHPYVIRKQAKWYLRPIVHGMRMRVIKRINGVVACAESLQKEFRDDLNMKVYAVQNGVNTDFFTPVNADEKLQLRRKLQLPEISRIFLVLGNVCERKNVGLIIDAYKKIESSGHFLLIVGDGEQAEEMKKKAAYKANIIFRSKTSTPVEYLQASDILVSAALSEGLPNTVLEGLSCGLPCVLSDIGPHKELIEQTQAGILFTNNSGEDLCRAFQVSLGWNMKERSTAARNEAVCKHSIDCLAANYMTIYREVLASIAK